MTYTERLQDPRWQKRRLEVLQRDKFTCQQCGDASKTLHVHHRYYVAGRMPWEYPSFCYQTLCVDCHTYQHDQLDEARENGWPVVDLWEVGLNHFGDKIFDMAAEERIKQEADTE